LKRRRRTVLLSCNTHVELHDGYTSRSGSFWTVLELDIPFLQLLCDMWKASEVSMKPSSQYGIQMPISLALLGSQINEHYSSQIYSMHGSPEAPEIYFAFAATLKRSWMMRMLALHPLRPQHRHIRHPLRQHPPAWPLRAMNALDYSQRYWVITSAHSVNNSRKKADLLHV